MGEVIYPSRVILISNLGNVFRGAEELFNLLSCFGIVVGIIFMRNKQKAFLEYSTIESATECITNLNGLSFGPTCFSVIFSKYQNISFINKSNTFNIHNEILQGNSLIQRYEKSTKIDALLTCVNMLRMCSH